MTTTKSPNEELSRLSVRVDAGLDGVIQIAAARRRLSRSELVIEILSQALSDEIKELGGSLPPPIARPPTKASTHLSLRIPVEVDTYLRECAAGTQTTRTGVMLDVLNEFRRRRLPRART